MGHSQSLPLPRRIPFPSVTTLESLLEIGVKIHTSDDMYVPYSLPDMWTMVDRSPSEDLPKFYMVDELSRVRVSILDIWKQYSQFLEIIVEESPYDVIETV